MTNRCEFWHDQVTSALIKLQSNKNDMKNRKRVSWYFRALKASQWMKLDMEKRVKIYCFLNLLLLLLFLSRELKLLKYDIHHFLPEDGCETEIEIELNIEHTSMFAFCWISQAFSVRGRSHSAVFRFQELRGFMSL